MRNSKDCLFNIMTTVVFCISWTGVLDGRATEKDDKISVLIDDLQRQINELKTLNVKCEFEIESLKTHFQDKSQTFEETDKTEIQGLKTDIEYLTKKILAIERELKPSVEISGSFESDPDFLKVNKKRRFRSKREINRAWTGNERGSGLTQRSHKTRPKSRNAEELGGQFEGDMVFPSSGIQSSGIANRSSLWPDGCVVYKLDRQFTGSEKKRILNAMWEISVKTCVEFKELHLEDKLKQGFVEIIRGSSGSGCWADVGYRGGHQKLNLQFNACIYHGIIIHELLHTLGFFHEQSRADRDEYIEINLSNIDIYERRNFEKFNSSYVTDYELPYDYSSIMHYDDNFFALNPELPTIIVKDPFAYIGNRQSLSELDVERIRRRYNTSDLKCRCSAPTNCTKERQPTESDVNSLFDIHQNTKIELVAINQTLEKLTSFAQNYPKSCGQIDPLLRWQNVQKIYPHGREKPGVSILCDFETDGGGWSIIQKRSSGPKDEFHREWAEYEQGFGSPHGNFWIGLKTIHALTKDGDQELRVDLWDFESGHAFAKYSNFSISDSSDFYRLSIGGYSGTAGDSLYVDNNMRFSTKDKDNDIWLRNCAEDRRSGWWFEGCSYSNLNGLYYEKGETANVSRSNVHWWHWKNSDTALRQVELKVRSRL